MNTQMSKETAKEERIEAWIETLEDAQEKMREAFRLIDNYVYESNDRNTEAYIADHLRILIDDDHGFASRDRNLADVINELRYSEEELDRMNM